MVIVKNRPKGFISDGKISCIYVLYADEILFLQYSKSGTKNPELKYKWTLVSGKVEEGESETEAAIRELFEETGIEAGERDLSHIGKYYYKGNMNREVNDYLLKITQKPKIVLSDEHINNIWVNKEDVINLDLVRGRKEIWLHQFKKWDRIIRKLN